MRPLSHRGIIVASFLITAASAAERRPTFAELAGASDKIVLGTVSVKSSYWGDPEHIYTDVLIAPDVTIQGEEEGPVTVRVLGGTVGDTVMTVSDGPEFPEGERLVVFLKREGSRFTVVGRSAGSVRAASAEGAEAADRAFQAAERRGGRRFTYQRGLAARYLGNGLTANAQTGCYGTDGSKWGVSSAGYRIGWNIPANWAASIDAAAATWNAAGAAFQLRRDDASLNELTFQDLVALYGPSYSDTLAVTTTWSNRSTGAISKAAIAVNSNFAWSTTGEAGKDDVQNILTHEFGHWMRLLDIYSPSSCGDVTMWGSAGNGETKKRTLAQADIDGIRSLYPAGAPAVSAPSLISPLSGATGVTGPVVLVWGASNATAYDVYLGTTPSPALVGTVAGTTYLAGVLSPGTTYYWRVVAKNGTGSAAAATWSFTVAAAPSNTDAVSTAPALLSPANGATGVPVRASLQWSAVKGTRTFDVFIGGSANILGHLGSVMGTSVTARGLQRNTTYYWKVVAYTPTGPVSSPLWSFRTGAQ